MIKTEGIIFKTIPFGETSMILEIYTKDHGMEKFIVGGARKRKNNLQYLYQVLQPINLLYYPGKGDSLKRIKEASINYRYQLIFSDISINAIATCMIDFTRQSIKEYENNDLLFAFIKDSLLTLDNKPLELGNFHLHYLFELTKHIGIFPHDNKGPNKVFNLKEGAFCHKDEGEPIYCLSLSLSHLFGLFLSKNDSKILINKGQRNDILDALTSYYIYHLQNFKKPKSIDIIKVIFAA